MEGKPRRSDGKSPSVAPPRLVIQDDSFPRAHALGYVLKPLRGLGCLSIGGQLMRSIIAALMGFAIAASILNASTGSIPLNCNRACLENVVDQYLSALVARDPKRLPVSKDVKYTENDQVIELGDGFWKTV